MVSGNFGSLTNFAKGKPPEGSPRKCHPIRHWRTWCTCTYIDVHGVHARTLTYMAYMHVHRRTWSTCTHIDVHGVHARTLTYMRYMYVLWRTWRTCTYIHVHGVHARTFTYMHVHSLTCRTCTFPLRLLAMQPTMQSMFLVPFQGIYATIWSPRTRGSIH